MIKKVVYILTVMTILTATFALAQHFWRGETMSPLSAKKKWGSLQFDPTKFKSGDEKLRASMTYSIVSTNALSGKDPNEIRQILGDPDGFYFVDMFPAYIIQSGKNKNEDTWQIVFLLDRNHKSKEVIIHKNCCDR